jgi:hypothetical protein
MSNKRDKNKRKNRNSKMKKQMQKISDLARANSVPLMHAIFWRQRAGFYAPGTPEHP